ncbi:MAG: Gfo/Idh/MocA family protein [Verrucomicrobiia bacterium]|jgi:predicted dehydrogenase
MPVSRRTFVTRSTTTIGALTFPFVARAVQPPKIRIGQIGTLHPHAGGKLTSIRKLPDTYDLVAIVEPDEERRRVAQNSKSWRGLKWVSQEQLLNTNGLQVVAVETAVRDLVPTAMSCIAAGKHIHLDKPAGPSMNACRALHAAARRRGLTIQMGYMLRYNPAFQLLFQMVRDGWLGRITELSAMMGKRGGDGMRKQLAEFAGGGMFELSCHIIDAMVTVLGKPEKVTAHNRHSYPAKDNFADNQMAVYDYPHALATIRCNHLDPFGFPRRFFNVTGELGSVFINPLEPPQMRIALDRSRGEFKKGFQDVTLPKKTDRYLDEFIDLAKVIRGEKQLAWDSDHDLAVQEAVLLGSGMKLD